MADTHDEKKGDSIFEAGQTEPRRLSDPIITAADKAALELEAIERHTHGEKPTLWMWVLTAVAGIVRLHAPHSAYTEGSLCLTL